MAVLSALNNSSVQRLRNLWATVRKEHRDAIHHFELFMSMSDNFKHYRYVIGSSPRHSWIHLSHIDHLIIFMPPYRRHITKMTDQAKKTPVVPFLRTDFLFFLSLYLL
jgi:hypothetical protein